MGHGRSDGERAVLDYGVYDRERLHGVVAAFVRGCTLVPALGEP